MRKFCWVRGIAGPEPQIITDVVAPMSPERAAERIIASFEIDDEVTLGECVIRYPKPEVRFF